MVGGTGRSRARGATALEVVVVVGLVALAAIGAVSHFGGNVGSTTTSFGTKLRNMTGTGPVAASANTAAGMFVATPQAAGGCGPTSGCGASGTPGATPTPTTAVTAAERNRIDGIVRSIFAAPTESRNGILRGLSPTDFNAVNARIGQLDAAMKTLQNSNDPAYTAFNTADANYQGEVNGFFAFFRGSEIASTLAARRQANDALLTRLFQTIDSGRSAPPGAPGGGSAAYGELFDVMHRTEIAPDLASTLTGWGLSDADRARTWDIQRSRDAEAAQIKAFGDYVMTQPREVQSSVAQGQQEFLAQIRASLPPSVQGEFDRYFTAHTIVVDGQVVYRITPTEELRRLQDQQAAMIGVDLNRYQSSRTVPFNAPANGEESFSWWLTYGSIDPRSLAARWNPPPSDAINTADEVFALIPVGTAVTVARGVGVFAFREIAAMATREVVANVVVLGASSAVAEKYGPLAGTGTAVGMVVAALVTHRFVTAPNVLAAAERFGGCFVAGTLVATSMGLMPIEKIEVGMQVLSRDADTHEIAYAPVLKTFVKHDKAIVRVSLEDVVTGTVEVLGTTEEHPFWLEGQGWTPAADLLPGERLSTANGAVLVRSLSLEREPQDVYNFEVSRTHSYFVGRFETWVHNLCEQLIARLVRQTEGGTFTIARRNFPGIGEKVIGAPDAIVPAHAATEAAAALALARQPGVVRVYVGAEADAFFIAEAQRAGVQVPTRMVNGVQRVDATFPDVIAVNSRGQWILAEGKGGEIGHIGQQFETVNRYMPGRVVDERVYTSAIPTNGNYGTVGGGSSNIRVIAGRAVEVVPINPGDSTRGLTRIINPSDGMPIWVRPWKPNGRIIQVFTPDAWRRVLER